MKRLCWKCVSFVVLSLFICVISITSANDCRIEDTTITLDLAIPTDEFMEKAKRRNLNITEQNFKTVVSAYKTLAYSSIDQLVENNFLNFIAVLFEIEDTSVQIQAANALTIVTSGNMNGTIKAVFDAGALPVLISRLSSTNQVILEKVLLALGDIAMESAHYRDLCIEAGIVDLVLDLIHPDLPLSVLHKIVRVIACLCHSKDPPISIELIKQVLPTLHQLIQREDSDVPIELVLTFLQIAEQGTEQVQMIIDSGTVPRIVSLLNHKNADIVQLNLRLLERIVIEAYSQLQPFFDDKIMELVLKLLSHSNKAVGVEAVHFFSQVISASTNQTVLLFDTDLLPLIADLLKQRDQRKEVALIISDLAIYEKDYQIQHILRRGIVGYLCGTLELDDGRTRLAALEGLNTILTKWPKHRRSVLRQVIKNKGLEKLERLENHSDLDTSMLAIDILETLFTARKKERASKTDNIFQMILLPFKELFNVVLSWLFEFVIYAKLLKQYTCDSFCQEIEAVDRNEPRSNKDAFKMLERLAKAVKTGDPEIRVDRLAKIRRIVSANNNPPISELIGTGFLPTLVEYLESDNLDIRHETALIAAKIASGNDVQVKELVDAGAIRPLIKLLSSDDLIDVEHAAWALEKITEKSPEFCDQCLQLGIFDSLLRLSNLETSLKLLRAVTKMFLNLCQHKIEDSTASQILQKMLPALLKLIKHSDYEVLHNVLWTIANITDKGSENIQLVLDAKLLSHVLGLLQHRKVKIVTPALRVIANIATGTETQKQRLLNGDVLKLVAPLLRVSENKIKKDAVWLISSISVGPPKHIHDIFDAKLMSSVNKLLVKGDSATQTEAARVISNIVIGGKQDELIIIRLFEWDVVEAICMVLQTENHELIHTILNIIDDILETMPYNKRDILLKLLKHNGLAKINEFRDNEDKEFAQLSSTIVEKLFVGKNNERLDESNNKKWIQLKEEVRQKIEL